MKELMVTAQTVKYEGAWYSKGAPLYVESEEEAVALIATGNFEPAAERDLLDGAGGGEGDVTLSSAISEMVAAVLDADEADRVAIKVASFTAAGVPECAELTTRLNTNVTANDRNEAWFAWVADHAEEAERLAAI